MRRRGSGQNTTRPSPFGHPFRENKQTSGRFFSHPLIPAFTVNAKAGDSSCKIDSQNTPVVAGSGLLSSLCSRILALYLKVKTQSVSWCAMVKSLNAGHGHGLDPKETLVDVKSPNAWLTLEWEQQIKI